MMIHRRGDMLGHDNNNVVELNYQRYSKFHHKFHSNYCSFNCQNQHNELNYLNDDFHCKTMSPSLSSISLVSSTINHDDSDHSTHARMMRQPKHCHHYRSGSIIKHQSKSHPIPCFCADFYISVGRNNDSNGRGKTKIGEIQSSDDTQLNYSYKNRSDRLRHTAGTNTQRLETFLPYSPQELQEKKSVVACREDKISNCAFVNCKKEPSHISMTERKTTLTSSIVFNPIKNVFFVRQPGFSRDSNTTGYKSFKTLQTNPNGVLMHSKTLIEKITHTSQKCQSSGEKHYDHEPTSFSCFQEMSCFSSSGPFSTICTHLHGKAPQSVKTENIATFSSIESSASRRLTTSCGPVHLHQKREAIQIHLEPTFGAAPINSPCIQPNGLALNSALCNLSSRDNNCNPSPFYSDHPQQECNSVLSNTSPLESKAGIVNVVSFQPYHLDRDLASTLPRHKKRTEKSINKISAPLHLQRHTKNGLQGSASLFNDNYCCDQLSCYSYDPLSFRGLHIPHHLLLQMLQTPHVTLMSQLIKKHPGPLFHWGIPYIRKKTLNWIQIVGLLMCISLVIETAKIALAMSRMAVALTAASMPITVMCQFIGYLSLRIASYWILIIYTLSQAFTAVFDVVLMMAFGTAFYRNDNSPPIGHPIIYFLSTLSSCLMTFVCSIVVGRVCVLVRRDVAELSTRIPIERLDESLDPQPFLLWYFALPPPNSLDARGKSCTPKDLPNDELKLRK